MFILRSAHNTYILKAPFLKNEYVLTRPASNHIYILEPRLAFGGMKLHIQEMAKTAKTTPTSSHVETPGRTVIYRGIKIIPMTAKRSALAEAIREGLWSKSERRLGDTSEA